MFSKICPQYVLINATRVCDVKFRQFCYLILIVRNTHAASCNGQILMHSTVEKFLQAGGVEDQ